MQRYVDTRIGTLYPNITILRGIFFYGRYLKQNTVEALALLPASVTALQAIHTIMEAAFIKNDLMKEAEAEAARNKAEDAAQPAV